MKAEMKARKKPAPSVVAPARYRVGAPPFGALGASAWSPAGEGDFAAPLGDSPQELAVRTHEYGHLYALRRGLHPRRPDSVLKELENLGVLTPNAPVIVQAAVDSLIHGLLDRRGLGEKMKHLPVHVPQESDAVGIVRAFLQSLGTAVEREAERKARELPEAAYNIASRVANTLYDYGYRLQRVHAKGLAHLLAPLLLLIDSPNEGGVDERLAEMASKYIDFTERLEARWGECEVKTASLTAPRRVRPTTGFRAGFVGAPVYWPRIPPAGDGAVFRTRRPTPGGTVLIDVSGSMGLDQEDVERIVAEAPGVTVALYASYDGHERGAVTIVAQGGRVADIASVLKAYAGGNVVDGPALEWLGRQKPPRIWVSDGRVTGHREDISPALVLDALRLCRKHGIKRVEPSWDTKGRLVLKLGQGVGQYD